MAKPRQRGAHQGLASTQAGHHVCDDFLLDAHLPPAELQVALVLLAARRIAALLHQHPANFLDRLRVRCSQLLLLRSELDLHSGEVRHLIAREVIAVEGNAGEDNIHHVARHVNVRLVRAFEQCIRLLSLRPVLLLHLRQEAFVILTIVVDIRGRFGLRDHLLQGVRDVLLVLVEAHGDDTPTTPPQHPPLVGGGTRESTFDELAAGHEHLLGAAVEILRVCATIHGVLLDKLVEGDGHSLWTFHLDHQPQLLDRDVHPDAGLFGALQGDGQGVDRMRDELDTETVREPLVLPTQGGVVFRVLLLAQVTVVQRRVVHAQLSTECSKENPGHAVTLLPLVLPKASVEQEPQAPNSTIGAHHDRGSPEHDVRRVGSSGAGLHELGDVLQAGGDEGFGVRPDIQDGHRPQEHRDARYTELSDPFAHVRGHNLEDLLVLDPQRREAVGDGRNALGTHHLDAQHLPPLQLAKQRVDALDVEEVLPREGVQGVADLDGAHLGGVLSERLRELLQELLVAVTYPHDAIVDEVQLCHGEGVHLSFSHLHNEGLDRGVLDPDPCRLLPLPVQAVGVERLLEQCPVLAQGKAKRR
mmetsp:Transcript_84877/g.274381  ORF Transcript_84877/g.274381 Transcript_84877/m.274381 type:complete len:585 (+) Transcript_84877:272-2026(+)